MHPNITFRIWYLHLQVNKIFWNQYVLVSNWFWQFTDAVIKKEKGKGRTVF